MQQIMCTDIHLAFSQIIEKSPPEGPCGPCGFPSLPPGRDDHQGDGQQRGGLPSVVQIPGLLLELRRLPPPVIAAPGQRCRPAGGGGRRSQADAHEKQRAEQGHQAAGVQELDPIDCGDLIEDPTQHACWNVDAQGRHGHPPVCLRPSEQRTTVDDFE